MRLRIINAAAQTTFNFRIPGLPMTLRVTDGIDMQPVEVEIDASFQDVPGLALGSGFSTAEFGARLRYGVFPRSGPALVAPYLGIQYERAFGKTARFRRGSRGGRWRLANASWGENMVLNRRAP